MPRIWPFLYLALLCGGAWFADAQTSQADLCECLISPVTLKIPNLNQTYGGNANALNGQATWVFVDDVADDAFVQHNVSLKICPTSTTSNLLTQYIDKLRIRVAVNQTIVFQQTVSITQKAVSTTTYCFTGFASFIDAGGSANMPRITVANPPVFYILDDRSVAYAVMGINAKEEVVQSTTPTTPTVPASGTTDAPTTAAPTTPAPTTAAPTTAAPTTVAPTTSAPTTGTTTQAPTTSAPTTGTTTQAPTTSAPTTGTTTHAPTTSAPTTTPAPTTSAPTTGTTTQAPTTSAPTTGTTTQAPTTPAPTTATPTTAAPTTAAPTTAAPTTAAPTTPVPTTAAPTTPVPTTAAPTLPPLPTPVYQIEFGASNAYNVSGSGSTTFTYLAPGSGTTVDWTTDTQVSGGAIVFVRNANSGSSGGCYHTTSLQGTSTSWSKTVWLKLNTLLSSGTLNHYFSSVGTASQAIVLSYPQGETAWKFQYPASTTLAVDATATPVNAWVHIGVTYSSSTQNLKIYHNGILSATTTGVAYIDESTSTHWVGGFYGTSCTYSLEGKSWKPAYYNKELSAAEMKVVFNDNCASVTSSTFSTCPLS